METCLVEHGSDSSIDDLERLETYTFSGDDPLRPEGVGVDFEWSDARCENPVEATGSLDAELVWGSSSVELRPNAGSLDASWSVELYPDTLAATLDDAGNVVEVRRAERSNLSELGLRYLGTEYVGYYTFEGAGDCRNGTNPHFSLNGVLPYHSLIDQCRTGQVRVSGYARACVD